MVFTTTRIGLDSETCQALVGTRTSSERDEDRGPSFYSVKASIPSDTDRTGNLPPSQLLRIRVPSFPHGILGE
jgi:hypothetical protein